MLGGNMMSNTKKRGLIIALAFFALAAAGLTALFISCGNLPGDEVELSVGDLNPDDYEVIIIPYVPEPKAGISFYDPTTSPPTRLADHQVIDADTIVPIVPDATKAHYEFLGWKHEKDSKGEQFDPTLPLAAGVYSVYAQYKPYTMIPHIEILKGSDASTNWPDLKGKDSYAANRQQIVVTWTEGLYTDIEIKDALTAFYNTYKEWETAFDPLPHFSVYASPGAVYGVDYGPNAKPRDQVAVFQGNELAQSSSTKISFVRYWPTDHFTKSEWDAGLTQRTNAYNAVRQEIVNILNSYTSPPLLLPYEVKVTINGNEVQVLKAVEDSLKEIIGNTHSTFVDYTSFNRFAAGGYNTYVNLWSDRLYEAYFGYIPPASVYPAGEVPTYPVN
jgi:hypothetical protein